MVRVSVDSQITGTAHLEAAPGVDKAGDALPSHGLAFGEVDCDERSERREHEIVALLAELRHWWWAGLISDGEYRAKEEEILQLPQT